MPLGAVGRHKTAVYLDTLSITPFILTNRRRYDGPRYTRTFLPYYGRFEDVDLGDGDVLLRPLAS